MVTPERRGELLALQSRDSYHGQHGDHRAKRGDLAVQHESAPSEHTTARTKNTAACAS
jgi:hypothetical protein